MNRILSIPPYPLHHTLEGLFNGFDLISSPIYLNLAAIIAIIDYNIAHIAKIAQSIYILIRYSSSQAKKAARISAELSISFDNQLSISMRIVVNGNLF
jgi:hypothetical protein